MAEAPQKDAGKRPLPGSPEARESGRRNLNSQIAQRQKMLLAGIGAIALIGGGMFIFGGDGDEAGTDANGAATIDTGGLVNRNLSQREFVASYGNRLDAQGRAIKDLQQAQLPRPEIEQELDWIKAEMKRARRNFTRRVQHVNGNHVPHELLFDSTHSARLEVAPRLRRHSADIYESFRREQAKGFPNLVGNPFTPDPRFLFRDMGSPHLDVPTTSQLLRNALTIVERQTGHTIEDGKLKGVITDGDLRRNLEGLMERTAGEVATPNPRTVAPDALLTEALGMMNARKISSLFAVEEDGTLVGLVHIHDALRAGVA